MLELVLKIVSNVLESPSVNEAIWPWIIIGAGMLLFGAAIIGSISDLEDEVHKKEIKKTVSIKIKKNYSSGNYNISDIGLRDENKREFQEINDLKLSKSLSLKKGDILELTN